MTEELEEKARLSGWVPLEEFKGDETRWTPAEDWVERTETIMPILKATNKKLEDELLQTKAKLETVERATKSEVQELRQTMEKMADVSAKVSKREYDRALETIKKQQVEAVSNADAEAWQQLETQKEKLEKPETIKVEKKEAPQKDNESEVVSDWMKDNEWFNKDPDLQAYAKSIEGFVANKNPNKPLREILDGVTEEVKTRYPDKFKNPNREKPPSVDGSGVQEGSSPPNKKGYASLPAEARTQCDKLISTVPGYTKEQYVNDYYS